MKIIKDKFLSAVVLTAAALCTSCSTDELTAQQQGQNEAKGVSLTATMDEAVTRAGIGKSDTEGQALCYWHKGDQISVQTVNTSGNTYSSAKFYTTDATGATTATFWSEPLSGETIGKYALYPYNEKHQFSETELTYNLPASYTYTTVGTDIFSNTDDGTYPGNSTNVPLLGTVDSENNNITFSHLGGLVVIRIDAMPYESGTLTVSADQQLSGNFKVNLSAGAQVLTTGETTTDADKQVAFTFSGATKDGIGVFYLPVATGDYTNLTIEISDGTNTQSIPYGTLSMKSANVWAIPLYNNDGTIEKEPKKEDGKYTINNHTFVDLGLPSGLLWAETNVGATNSYDFGNYYLCSEAAGAVSSWSSSCSLPTKDNFEELISNCSWTWTTENGVNGYKVTGKKDGYTGISIFLPAAGYGEYYMDFDMSTGNIVYRYPAYDENQKGYYWSTSTSQSLVFDSGSYNVGDIFSENKARVRPVAKKN